MSETEKLIFIAYRDDDDSIKQAWVDSVKSIEGFTIFSTSSKDNIQNDIAIPNHRVIKIKRRRGEDDESEGLLHYFD